MNHSSNTRSDPRFGWSTARARSIDRVSAYERRFSSCLPPAARRNLGSTDSA